MCGDMLRIRYNVMNIMTLEAFANIRGGLHGNCKDVYFLRAAGWNQNLCRQVEQMDGILCRRMNAGQGMYKRMAILPPLRTETDIGRYLQRYEKWLESGREIVDLQTAADNESLQRIVGAALSETLRLFKKITPSVSDSIVRNFAVKLLYWFEQAVADMLKQWDGHVSYKFVIENIMKKQEYLFCYFLTQIGIDILLLQNGEDISRELENLGLSEKFSVGDFKKESFPKYEPSKWEPLKVQIPRKADRIADRSTMERPDSKKEHKAAVSEGRRKLEFVELAKLATSVVMITLHDDRGEAIGGGSGIMIGREGYILTNHHVASRGRFFSVRIEEEEQTYTTDEVIKYNSVLDLAVIRIRRDLNPLPVYQGNEELLRGEKVVAIGSPLGLFNSVSDGIIAGFRKIDGVDMIQFTAPISHGSSGGAVLNMYGEVIGISTAGIDNGQNLNLAVGYQFINQFIRGLR